MCPICTPPTTRRHSRYRRLLADTPCADQAVRLELHTRRFFCPNSACPRRVFAERLPQLTRPAARRTTRLTALLQRVGLALGGEVAITQLDPYRAYLQERWATGCHNAARLWRDVRAQGYGGVYAFLRTLDGPLRQAKASGGPYRSPTKRPGGPAVRRRDWQKYLSPPPSSLKEAEQTLVEQVCAQAPEVGTLYKLVQPCGRLIRDQRRAEWDDRIAAAVSRGIEEVSRFARGIQADYAGVAAALEQPWSNGPVEGHVNRLKALKRQMFGRAKFPLLRKRVLCAA